MTKLESIAKVIFEHHMGSLVADWYRQPDSIQGFYRSDARAAVEAMREPTDAMIAAMDEHAGSIALQYAYEDAIDAILNEEKP